MNDSLNPLVRSLSEAFGFAVKFFKNPRSMASLIPSSHWLAEAVTAPIDWNTAKVVVELGGGTGALTQAIAKKVPGDGVAYVIERDPDFVKILEEKFGAMASMRVIAGDALDAAMILEKEGITQVDAIVSGLGVGIFTDEERDRYFANIKKILKPGGVYTQITETPTPDLFIAKYTPYFTEVRYEPEWRNIPPAGIFICKSPK